VEGDAEHWARVEALAGEFSSADEALREFEEEFGPRRSLLHDRCFFLVDGEDTPIGTAMAWDGDFAGEVRGRVHWVGIVPAYQGRGLAKPLLSTVLQRLARDHRAAFLTTQTTTWRAVNLYLNFGFVPYLDDASGVEGWRIMEQVLRRRILGI
jgi:ribosomal protein S18 acetylase RimI-like enzyme